MIIDSGIHERYFLCAGKRRVFWSASSSMIGRSLGVMIYLSVNLFVGPKICTKRQRYEAVSLRYWLVDSSRGIGLTRKKADERSDLPEIR